MIEKFAAQLRKNLIVMAAVAAVVAHAPFSHAAVVSAQEAVDRVQQETGGKVLSVQTLRVGKRKIFRIKVLTPNGQVRVIEVQADQ